MEDVIINSVEEIVSQLEDFKIHYPNMKVLKQTSTEIRLGGSFTMHKEYGGFQVNNTYLIEIVIPISSTELPYVIDVGKHISPTYHHYYSNGKLCLETDAKILSDYVENFNIVHWMDKYVESYFYAYAYYMRFDEFPYGERSHGLEGVLEAYQELLNAKDVVETYEIMRYMYNNQYRGHFFCPCKSGKKIRNCHGPYMIKFYKNKCLNNVFVKDYLSIKGGVDNATNKAKTK